MGAGNVLPPEAHMAAGDKMSEAIGQLAIQHAGDGGAWDLAEDVLGKKPSTSKDSEESIFKKTENRVANPVNQTSIEDDDLDDDELDRMLDDDPELNRIRMAKLAEMKSQADARLELKAKGHGEYREIVQDEFLPEVTKTEKCLLHFYHRDFEKCKIIDHHLKILAPQYMECKFLTINAEKAPFFVEKLGVRVLPTIVCFINGIVVDKVIGFEGLGKDLPDDRVNEFPTRDLARRLGEGEQPVITYVAPPSEKELEDYGMFPTKANAMSQECKRDSTIKQNVPSVEIAEQNLSFLVISGSSLFPKDSFTRMFLDLLKTSFNGEDDNLQYLSVNYILANRLRSHDLRRSYGSNWLKNLGKSNSCLWKNVMPSKVPLRFHHGLLS